MMLLPPMKSFIPADHRLRKLGRVLDLSFVHAAVRDRYCQDNGRPSVDPEAVLPAALVRLRADSRTDSFKELYRTRSPVIEGVFGEGKQWQRGLIAAGSPISRLVTALSDLLSTLWSARRCHWSSGGEFVQPMIAARPCV
jgi:hypothetical protein